MGFSRCIWNRSNLEAFGLIDTAEKSAEVLVKVLSMGGKRQTITSEEFKLLAERFGVTPMEDAINSKNC